ncbi:MAG: hypothetical protein GY765_32525, partial [bacterium]|nr:hypothetical protein [bacterium]
MKYRQIILSVAAILGLILSGACSKSGNGNSAIVIKGPFHIKVQSNGQLKSSDSLHIGCPSIRRTWNFTISFMAPEGKEVAPGTPILGFDTKQLAEKLALRQSQLQTARKELEKIELVEQEKLDKLHLQAAEAKATTNKAKRKAEQPEEFTALNELKKLRMDYKLAQLKEQLMQKRIDNQISGMKTRINAQKNKITTYDQMVK